MTIELSSRQLNCQITMKHRIGKEGAVIWMIQNEVG